MTPEGKAIVEEIIEPFGGRVELPIEQGQDFRYISLVVGTASDQALNALDSEKLLLHSDEDIQKAKATRAGRPLLKILGVRTHMLTSKEGVDHLKVFSVEDVNTEGYPPKTIPKKQKATRKQSHLHSIN